VNEAKDFARIERASDGRQVLFYKSTDDEGKPQLRQVTEHEGVIIEMNLSFGDDDAGWAMLDRVFDGVEADKVVAAILQAIGEGEPS
jgi:hypothetical protein